MAYRPSDTSWGSDGRQDTRATTKKEKQITSTALLQFKIQEDSVSSLTQCEVVYLRWQSHVNQCGVVCVDVCLGWVSVSQSREAAAEGGKEDRQHPKVQEVPRFHQVLPWTLAPDLLHLCPDHTCIPTHNQSWNTQDPVTRLHSLSLSLTI